MRSSRWWLIPVGIAGVLDFAMAIAHFGLQWEWHQVTDFGTLLPQLRWALFALNFSWAVLLLGVSALVLSAASRGFADAMAPPLLAFPAMMVLLHSTALVATISDRHLPAASS